MTPGCGFHLCILQGLLKDTRQVYTRLEGLSSERESLIMRIKIYF
jgi:hypothetical protein